MNGQCALNPASLGHTGTWSEALPPSWVVPLTSVREELARVTYT